MSHLIRLLVFDVRGGACVCFWVEGGSLEGIQKAVDAADELLSLARQILLALDVRLLLDFTRHQTLRLRAGATHQLLHLAVQLLHLYNLRKGEGRQLGCSHLAHV